MHNTQVIEVVLRVVREALLVRLIMLAVVVRKLGMVAAGMNLGVVFLVEGKVLD